MSKGRIQPRDEPAEPHDPLLTPREVAKLFNVDPKTVSRWDNEGKLPAIRTPTNHRRFRRSDVLRYLKGEAGPVIRPQARSSSIGNDEL